MNEDGDNEGIHDLENDPNIAEDASPTSHDNSTSSFDSGPNIRMGIDLLHLCTESQVPLHLYDKVLQFSKNTQLMVQTPRPLGATISQVQVSCCGETTNGYRNEAVHK
jgi:hypothetical protein